MSKIINAVFGRHNEAEEQTKTTETRTSQSSSAQSASGQQAAAGQRDALHTSAVSGDVQVKSVISSESEANAHLEQKFNIDGLLSQLNSTHSEVDKYSRTRTAEINAETQKSITAVLERTKKRQEELIANANQRHLALSNEYKAQLKKAVEELDALRAKSLAELERDLQAKQLAIMNEAKAEVDVLNDNANAAKLEVLRQAQEQTKKEMKSITEQVVSAGQQGAEGVLKSTTTTTITSTAETAGKVTAESAHQSGGAVQKKQTVTESASGSHTSSSEHHAESGTHTSASEHHVKTGSGGKSNKHNP